MNKNNNNNNNNNNRLRRLGDQGVVQRFYYPASAHPESFSPTYPILKLVQ